MSNIVIQSKERIFIEKKKLVAISKKYQKYRTQDLIPKYYDSGQFYAANYKTWLNINKCEKIGINIPSYRSVDIDTNVDWEKAEILQKIFSKS